MSTTNKKLVVVLGATGAQGNPVAKYLLAHSSHLYTVRAITRNASKPISLELSSLGAEVVEADFSSASSLTTALSGAWAIFFITNFWDQADFDLEVTQGKLINKLASQIPHLEHYVFSSLPDGRKFAGGKFQNILPYNAKAVIKEDLVGYEGLKGKMTEILVGFYYQNWLKYSVVFAPTKREDGTWVMSMPFDGSKGVPMAWADDVAPYVDAVLKGGERYRGKTITVLGEIMGHGEMLDVWSKHLGVKAVFKQVTPEEHVERMKKSGLPEHIAVAVTELSQALVLEERVVRDEILANGNILLPEGYKLKTWEQYVKEEDWSEMLRFGD